MNFKSLSKINDEYIKKSERIDVPSGKPTDLNLLDFREAVEEVSNSIITNGRLKNGRNEYLGIKVTIPRSFQLHSLKEPLELIGTTKVGNDLVAYFRPSSGWNNAQSKEI